MSKKNLSRRAFLGRSAAGASALAFSPALLELLLGATGCKSGPGGAGEAAFILADDVLRKAVSHLMARGADFGDVFVERAAIDSVMSDDRKINTTTTIEKGVGPQGRQGRPHVLRLHRQLRARARLRDGPLRRRRGRVARRLHGPARHHPGAALLALAFPIKPLPSEIAVDRKIELFKALTDRAWSADARVVQALQLLREILRQVTIATSSGRIVHQTLGLTEFIAQTYVKGADGSLQAAWTSAAPTRGATSSRATTPSRRSSTPPRSRPSSFSRPWIRRAGFSRSSSARA